MKLSSLLPLLQEGGITIVSKEPNGGGWVPCLCPFAPYLHERGVDKNPSFFVKVSNDGVSACHCFTCKEHGRLSTIFRKLAYHSGESNNALVIRADMAEIPSKFGEFDEEAVFERRESVVEEIFLNMYPLAWEDKRCASYLRGRGISKATSELLGLRFDDREMRVLFPVKGYRGELYGYSGRAIGEFGHSRHRDYGFRKELCLLGEHLFQSGKPLFIVEGLFAFAHLIEIGGRGWCNPMATLGATVSREQRDIIVDFDVPVYLCFDDDAAGNLGMFGKDGKGGAVAFLKDHVPVRVPLYPDKVADVDFLNLQQLQDMLKVIDNE